MARELSNLQPSTGPPLSPEERFGLTDPARPKQQKRADERPANLEKLIAAVEKVSADISGEAVIELANGQVWKQMENVTGFYVNAGDSATITRGVLGSYWMTVSSRPPARVRRVR